MFVLERRHTLATEIRKSRFIATASPVDTPEQATELTIAISDPRATHNCWAYRIGDQYRFTDDGEPGGTAGRPILAAIEGQDIDRCLVVVTRFFGGIKLGSGGLVRAYGSTAAECLRQAPKREHEPRVSITVRAPFDSIGKVYPLLAKFVVEKMDETYGEDGVLLRLEMSSKNLSTFEGALRDATGGKASIAQ